eukprot:evm.model.scf_1028.5 EVM.evm.TU.scf_1028.5   scf_1028:24833-37008(+)
MSLSVMSGSTHNLAALLDGASLPGSHASSRTSMDSGDRMRRVIIVANKLPVKAKPHPRGGWAFEWDDDALILQAKDGIDESLEVMYVGGLSVEVDPADHEAVASRLRRLQCVPVFLDKELKDRFYKGCCKQQLWPLFHYVLPNAPLCNQRFDLGMWQAYKRANMVFAQQVISVLASKKNYVWIHDYHLLVLPSLLRMRIENIRCGLFMHSPFPSSEIFRTYPMREDILRSMLNADLVGFHTFDYARHFLSCCSRLLGLEHRTSRGSLGVEYYGRYVGIKIMPTGVNPERFLTGMKWNDTKWRRGELLSEHSGRKILIGVDDMDTFKGIDLKLSAYRQFLELHPEWREQVVLIQITNPIRQSGPEIQTLLKYVKSLIEGINKDFGRPGYQPVIHLDRPMPIYEKMAFYSIGDVLVLTATRDGMNLAPYAYVVCRQGAPAEENAPKTSGLVVSEFVGCSPSLSGAIRVNPWSIDSVADGIYSALTMPLEDQQFRHDKHWRYVSQHTVAFWAQSYTTELERITQGHHTMKCYKLGLGLNTFRMVALDKNFRKLDPSQLLGAYNKSSRRVLLLDYDGTLIPPNCLKPNPPSKVLAVLNALCSDKKNLVYMISGRAKKDLAEWFGSVDNLGLAAEHGFFFKKIGSDKWEAAHGMVLLVHRAQPRSALNPFVLLSGPGQQAKELMDHLEEILSSEPVEVVSGHFIVEIKPQGVSRIPTSIHILSVELKDFDWNLSGLSVGDGSLLGAQ